MQDGTLRLRLVGHEVEVTGPRIEPPLRESSMIAWSPRQERGIYRPKVEMSRKRDSKVQEYSGWRR